MATRSKSANIFVYILLGLLFVGLAGFSTGGFGGSVRSVGQVGEIEIPVNDYYTALQSEMRVVQAQTGQGLTMEQARAAGLDQRALARLIALAALDNETLEIGLSVGDDVVSEQVLAIPQFSDLTGQFDRAAYEAILRNQGMTVRSYEERVRRETARSLLQRAVIEGTPAPQTYVDTVMTFLGERRTFEWAEVTADALSTPLAEPTEGDLQAQYDSTPEAYTLPEQRAITYAWITPAQILDTVEVPEDSLRQAYDDQIDQFRRPARRLADRIIFESAEAATAAATAIATGETSFEDLAEARGLSFDDIDQGEVTEAELGAIGAQVFALTEPGIVGPVETNLGPALYQVNAILEAQETSFDEALPQLREGLAADRARRVIQDMIEEVDDLLAGGATLEEVAAETELQLGEVLFSDNSDADIAGYPAFRAAAASVTTEDFPEVAELADGGIFAIRLNEVIPPTLQPLADVRDQVITDWEAAATKTALTAQVDDLRTALEGGALFSEQGLEGIQEVEMRRDSFVAGAPPSLTLAAFQIAPGEIDIVEGLDSIYIVRLNEILAPDLEDDDIVRVGEFLEEQAQQGLAQDILTAFTDAVQGRAGIQINQQALNAVHSQTGGI